MSEVTEAFRHAMSLTATGVAVIATQGPGGRAGATVSSFSSLSLAPPSVMANLHRDSRTLAAIKTNGAFAISVLAHRHQDIAKNFACASDQPEDAFEYGDWRLAMDGAPVINDAIVALGCRLARCFDYGAAVIVVGEVVSVDSRIASPLLYSARKYRQLA